MVTSSERLPPSLSLNVGQKMTMSKPNILYIHSHDTGRYIQPYGHAVPTPNLQRLAESGVLFRQNFCVSPTCSPSRASLLTGSYPHENGMLGLAHRGFSLNNYRQHILHTLRREGYLSALAGVQHIASKHGDNEGWKVIGYDQYLGEPAHEQAVTFLDNPPSQPFFLSIGFSETHREFPEISSECQEAKYCLPPALLPDTPETRRDMARFKASAKILDQKIGVVLKALEKHSLRENTLVICTTDHGIPFPRMKCNLHDSGIGVMLIMRGPFGFSGGKVIDAMTSHLDLFPTICDLLQIEHPKWLRGKSLMPLIRKKIERLHDELFFEINYHAAYEPMRSVRTRRWKYIKRFDERNRPVLPNCDDGDSKTLWMQSGWMECCQPGEMLYDLIFDPNEVHNLATDGSYEKVLQMMRERLNKWMRATNDPLLKGSVEAPAGAKVNDPDGISARDVLRSAQQGAPANPAAGGIAELGR